MNFTPEELEMYRKALKDKVCSICRTFGYEDTCAIGAEGECPIDHHLPRLLTAILSTPRSKDIGDYIPRVRQQVCRRCPEQNDRGVCKTRDRAYCGLDSFLVLIAQAIEDAHDRKIARRQ